jgi:hypothetical protein
MQEVELERQEEEVQQGVQILAMEVMLETAIQLQGVMVVLV